MELRSYTFEDEELLPLSDRFAFPATVLVEFLARATPDGTLSRSGYEAAEKFQNGAVSPILSRLKAIWK
jgi:hypothetical protein